MAEARRLPLFVKVVYGSGDWSLSSFNTFRQIFYAIFLTDVVGLEPRLASIAAVLGVIWDAVNDPMVGALSDRLRSPRGRRLPFLRWFALPFGFAFLALWWAPPWDAQWAKALHCCLAYMLADTVQSLVAVPFYALTPELSSDPDEVTQITAWRMLFNLIASLAVAIAAPGLVDAATAHGFSAQQGYLLVSALFGGLGVIPFAAIALVVKERPGAAVAEPPGLVEVVRGAAANRPFRVLAVMYALNWITFDLVGLMIPFLVTWWIAAGDASAQVNFFGVRLAAESAVFAPLLVLSVPGLMLWTWVSSRLGKRTTYLVAMSTWVVAQFGMLFVPQGGFWAAIALGACCSLGVASAHVLPDAMIPEVIDWDELQHGKRTEGIYYGAKNLLRKLTGAGAIFLALQVLGWAGYRAAPSGVVVTQPDSALLAIRVLAGPGGAALLLGAMAAAWFYPITRAKHAEIRAALDARAAGSATAAPPR